MGTEPPKAPQAQKSGLFSETPPEREVVPLPQLFVDVVQCQWAQPASTPAPRGCNKRLYSIGAELENLLQLSKIDPPVAALMSSALILSDLMEGLKAEDKKVETSFHKVHQASAWAIRASMLASFFNRATLMWLHQLLDKISQEDARLRQDLNKRP